MILLKSLSFAAVILLLSAPVSESTRRSKRQSMLNVPRNLKASSQLRAQGRADQPDDEPEFNSDTLNTNAITYDSKPTFLSLKKVAKPSNSLVGFGPSRNVATTTTTTTTLAPEPAAPELEEDDIIFLETKPDPNSSPFIRQVAPPKFSARIDDLNAQQQQVPQQAPAFFGQSQQQTQQQQPTPVFLPQPNPNQQIVFNPAGFNFPGQGQQQQTPIQPDFNGFVNPAAAVPNLPMGRQDGKEDNINFFEQPQNAQPNEQSQQQLNGNQQGLMFPGGQFQQFGQPNQLGLFDQQQQFGQPQFGQQQFGQPQFGQQQFGQPQFGQPQFGGQQFPQQFGDFNQQASNVQPQQVGSDGLFVPPQQAGQNRDPIEAMVDHFKSQQQQSQSPQAGAFPPQQQPNNFFPQQQQPHQQFGQDGAFPQFQQQQADPSLALQNPFMQQQQNNGQNIFQQVPLGGQFQPQGAASFQDPSMQQFGQPGFGQNQQFGQGQQMGQFDPQMFPQPPQQQGQFGMPGQQQRFGFPGQQAQEQPQNFDPTFGPQPEQQPAEQQPQEQPQQDGQAAAQESALPKGEFRSNDVSSVQNPAQPGIGQTNRPTERSMGGMSAAYGSPASYGGSGAGGYGATGGAGGYGGAGGPGGYGGGRGGYGGGAGAGAGVGGAVGGAPGFGYPAGGTPYPYGAYGGFGYGYRPYYLGYNYDLAPYGIPQPEDFVMYGKNTLHPEKAYYSKGEYSKGYGSGGSPYGAGSSSSPYGSSSSAGYDMPYGKSK